jgi:hypothetical protein
MASLPYRLGVFALYQFSIIAGIALFPLALLARRAGVSLPLHRVIRRLGDAYERASAA